MQEEDEQAFEYTPQQIKFLEYWGRQRQHKLRYMLLHGGLYIGVPLGIFNYFWDTIDFDMARFDFVKMLPSVAVFAFMGVMFGLYRFGVRDRNYLMLKELGAEES